MTLSGHKYGAKLACYHLTTSQLGRCSTDYTLPKIFRNTLARGFRASLRLLLTEASRPSAVRHLHLISVLGIPGSYTQPVLKDETRLTES